MSGYLVSAWVCVAVMLMLWMVGSAFVWRRMRSGNNDPMPGWIMSLLAVMVHCFVLALDLFVRHGLETKQRSDTVFALGCSSLAVLSLGAPAAIWIQRRKQRQASEEMRESNSWNVYMAAESVPSMITTFSAQAILLYMYYEHLKVDVEVNDKSRLFFGLSIPIQMCFESALGWCWVVSPHFSSMVWLAFSYTSQCPSF